MKIREKLRNWMKFATNREGEESEEEINYLSAKEIIKNDVNAVLLDVRSPQEYKEGHLESAINIPLYNLEVECEKKIKDKQRAIIIYCQSGNRSRKAIKILKAKKYNHLYQLKGGLDEI